MRSLRRLGLLVGSVLWGWALMFGSSSAAASDLLPRLVADPPTDAEIGTQMGHLYLRFNGYIHNVGLGPLEVRGERASTADPMSPYQRIYQTDGTYRDALMPGAQVIYEKADRHEHWHLERIVTYSLWNFARTRLVAPSMKVGFCLTDDQHVDPAVGPANAVYSNTATDFCERDNPAALSVWEGISPGWRDIYERDVEFQWVDISNVQPGVYWLREDVDPNRIVFEARPASPPAYAAIPTTVPGYYPQSLALRSVLNRSPTVITLRAKRYGPTGSVEFRITTPPKHGTLSVRVGSLFAHARIVYRPKAGYRGRDHFTYVALDSASSYPRHRARATISLVVRLS